MDIIELNGDAILETVYLDDMNINCTNIATSDTWALANNPNNHNTVLMHSIKLIILSFLQVLTCSDSSVLFYTKLSCL